MIYYQDDSMTLYHGDSLEILKTLQEESIDCVLTSPPYWSLRDYENKNQLGLEPTIKEYITKLCDIFDQIKRVLKKTGTCWVVIGDTYGGSNSRASNNGRAGFGNKREGIYNRGIEKCLMQIPSRFAIEMIDRGWLLRNELIWKKNNAIPQSAKDRFTVDFEKIYFFTKNKKYYFKQQFEEFKSNQKNIYKKRDKSKEDFEKNAYINGSIGKGERDWYRLEKRNKRCVWEINVKPFKGQHYAVYPEKLCMTPIDAGCPDCGVVLDPFHGSGTTGLVARKLNKKYIGIDLNERYLKMSLETRLKQMHLGVF